MWPRISTWDHQEQIQQVARAGLKPGTAGLQVWLADHSATLPPFMMIIGGCWLFTLCTCHSTLQLIQAFWYVVFHRCKIINLLLPFLWKYKTHQLHAYLVQSQNQEPYGSVNSKCTNNNTPRLHAGTCQAFTKLCFTTMGHLLSKVCWGWGISQCWILYYFFCWSSKRSRWLNVSETLLLHLYGPWQTSSTRPHTAFPTKQAWSIHAVGFHSIDVFRYHVITMVLK